MHMIKGSLGFGLFAMPLAFKFAGMFTGLIGTVLLCCVVWHCMHIFVSIFFSCDLSILRVTHLHQVKTSHDVCTKMRLPMLGYSKTVEIVLDMGPQPLPKYAYTMRLVLTYKYIFINIFCTSKYLPSCVCTLLSRQF